MQEYQGWTLRGTAMSVALLLPAIAAMSGCVGMQKLNTPSKEFVTATNALIQAESDYFDEIQAASNAGYILQATEDYVGHNGSFEKIAKELSRHDDFSKAKALRMAAMTQLQNFAKQIAAIKDGSSSSWIADDAKATATNLTALIKDAGDNQDSQLLTSHAGAIEGAVTRLGQAISIDRSAKEIQILAKEADEPIAQIEDMVKQDNENIESDKFTASLRSDQVQALLNILHFIYEDPKVSAYDRFNAIENLASRKVTLVTKGRAIQAALKSLRAANAAIAKKDDASAGPLLEQVYAYAKQSIAATTKSTGPTK